MQNYTNVYDKKRRNIITLCKDELVRFGNKLQSFFVKALLFVRVL